MANLGNDVVTWLVSERPQKWAGTLMDPPMSEPSSKGVMPAAKAAAEPPEDPPGVLSKSQGLFVVP